MLSKNKLVLYEIYPRSFQDSNGDGNGDLQGIISRLNYLQDLGVNALWLPPIFSSPMKDNGYDITDYQSIHPLFGTMDDFEKLVTEIHNRKMSLILDLVVNHTSEKHPWFLLSRSSRDNPKRNWYIWKDPVNGGVPNNWRSVFDPSVWEYDTLTGQYYYHSYLKEQPDLNWENPEVLEEVKKICTFWLDKGVDGLRLDGVNYYCKDQRFLDEPQNIHYDAKQAPFYQLEHLYMKDQPQHYALVGQLAAYVYQQTKAILIPQAHPAKKGIDSIPLYKKYYEVSTYHNVFPFNFELIDLPWKAKEYESFIVSYLHAIAPEDIPVFVLGSHDRKRVATRLGEKRARLAALMVMTLPGIPVIYYGEELGMQDVRPIPKGKLTDTKELRSPGFGRDPDRTPMQWDNSTYAGFSTYEPWLPLENEYKERNVTVEEADINSVLCLYKSLLKLRHADDTFTSGSFNAIDLKHESLFCYERIFEKNKYLICLNFSTEVVHVTLPLDSYQQIVSTSPRSPSARSKNLSLQPHEGIILKTLN